MVLQLIVGLYRFPSFFWIQRLMKWIFQGLNFSFSERNLVRQIAGARLARIVWSTSQIDLQASIHQMRPYHLKVGMLRYHLEFFWDLRCFDYRFLIFASSLGTVALKIFHWQVFACPWIAFRLPGVCLPSVWTRTSFLGRQHESMAWTDGSQPSSACLQSSLRGKLLIPVDGDRC